MEFYAKGIAYINETSIKTHVIDVNERPELAEKYRIVATSVLLIKSNDVIRKYFGIVDGLKEVLIQDMHGKSK